MAVGTVLTAAIKMQQYIRLRLSAGSGYFLRGVYQEVLRRWCIVQPMIARR